MSAVGKLTAIEDAIVVHLNSLVLSPELPIAYENVAFSPPADGAYLEATFLPNKPDLTGIGANAWERHKGLYQVLVHSPVGLGTAPGSSVADAVIEHFKNQVLEAYGIRVRIGSPDGGPAQPWRAGAFRLGIRSAIPVTIPWWADIDPAQVPVVA